MRSHDHLAARLENTCSLDEVEIGVPLLGALIVDEVPNIGGIKGSLRTSWKDVGPYKIWHLHHNVFSIKAPAEVADTLLNGGPWHVDNMRFNVVRWKPNLTICDVHLHKAWYWVQISGLSYEKFNSANARMIGAEIGDVLEVEDDVAAEATLRGYLRVKVSLDTRNPLPTGFWLPVSEYASNRVQYAYEGLRDFCYKCGKLGHHFKDCSNHRIIIPDDEESEILWYGPWMRKSPQIQSQRSWLDRPTRVHRRKPSTRRVLDRRLTPYCSGPGNGRMQGDVSASHSNHEARSQPSELDDVDGSFVSLPVTLPGSCRSHGQVQMDSRPANVTPFPSPHWLKLAVITKKTIEDWSSHPPPGPSDPSICNETTPSPSLSPPLFQISNALPPRAWHAPTMPSLSLSIKGPMSGKGPLLIDSHHPVDNLCTLSNSKLISLSNSKPISLLDKGKGPAQPLALSDDPSSKSTPLFNLSSARCPSARKSQSPSSSQSSGGYNLRCSNLGQNLSDGLTVLDSSRGRGRGRGRRRGGRSGRAGGRPPCASGGGLLGRGFSGGRCRMQDLPASVLSLGDLQEISVEILEDSSEVGGDDSTSSFVGDSSSVYDGGGWPTATRKP